MATNLNLTEGHFFISVDGNRLKQYTGNTVYLENGKEFQLEVFNPTASKVLAKIKINGNYISTSGLVLKPGQRVFLERYFDIAKKFKFETYSVDNSPETASAIANNGLIEVEFYKESIPVQITSCTYTVPIWNYPSWTTGGIYYSQTGGLGNGNVINTAYTSHPNSSALRGGITNSASASYSSESNSSALGNFDAHSGLNNLCSKIGEQASLDSLGFMDTNFERKAAQTEKKETGRVEAGSYSDQSFTLDYATYNSWYANKVSWKILPASQKPIEVSDLKVFCAECGAKKKKDSFKFCPHCGAKFE